MTTDRQLQLDAKKALSDVISVEAFIQRLGAHKRQGKTTAIRLMLESLNHKYGLKFSCEQNSKGSDVYMLSLEDLKKVAGSLKELVRGENNKNLQEIATILNDVEDTFGKKSWVEEKRFKHEFMSFDHEAVRYYNRGGETVDNFIEEARKDLETIKEVYEKIEEACEDYFDKVKEAKKELKDVEKGEQLEELAKKLVEDWPELPCKAYDKELDLLGYTQKITISGDENFEFPAGELRDDSDSVSLSPLQDEDVDNALKLIEDLADLLEDIESDELEFLEESEVNSGFQWEDDEGPVHELDNKLNGEKVWPATTDGLSWLAFHVESLIRALYDYMRNSVK